MIIMIFLAVIMCICFVWVGFLLVVIFVKYILHNVNMYKIIEVSFVTCTTILFIGISIKITPYIYHLCESYV